MSIDFKASRIDILPSPSSFLVGESGGKEWRINLVDLGTDLK
jgi:hypothetical protein